MTIYDILLRLVAVVYSYITLQAVTCDREGFKKLYKKNVTENRKRNGNGKRISTPFAALEIF